MIFGNFLSSVTCNVINKLYTIYILNYYIKYNTKRCHSNHNQDLSVKLHRRPIRQEAQLLQRDCATLRVIEYFAKSLKVIRNDTCIG